MSDSLEEIELIEGWQVAALGEMLRYPTVYVQRLVERLTFPAPGGQSWQRHLQLRLPSWEAISREGAVPPQQPSFIVPLGIFKRTRLPDFAVTDGRGEQCSLLTRMQHGSVMLQLALRQYLDEQQQKSLFDAKPDSDLGKISAAASRKLFELYTTVPGEPGVVSAEVAGATLADLLEALGVDEQLREVARGNYQDDFTALGRVTHYLCWVDAEFGKPLTLDTHYSMSAARFLSLTRALGRESTTTSGESDEGILATVRSRYRTFRRWFRRTRADFYARSGLGPANYELLARTTDHAGSYYFTIEPPPDTELTYLSWGSGNSFESNEEAWSCALPSIHEYHLRPLAPDIAQPAPTDSDGDVGYGNEDSDGASRWTIFAFMRPLPPNQPQLLLGAATNLVLAYLAQSGRLTSDLSSAATPLFLLTPAVLIAYIAHQRSHHYAAITGRLRAALWFYVAINLVFLFSVAFDVLDDGGVPGDGGVVTLMASSSAALLVVAAMIGDGYRKAIERLFRRRREQIESGKRKMEPKLKTFARASRRCGDRILGAAALAFALVGVCVGLILEDPAVPADTAVTEKPGTPTSVRAPGANAAEAKDRPQRRDEDQRHDD